MPKAIIYGKKEDRIKKIADSLKNYGFECLTTSSSDEMLQSIEFDDISVIVIEDSEASKEAIQLLKNLPMYKRRNLFVAATGENLPTMDRLFAFKEGLDLTVNYKDIDNFPLYFKRSYTEYQSLYKGFKEHMTKS